VIRREQMQASQSRKQRLLRRVSSVVISFLSNLTPWVAIPEYCPVCEEKLELTEDEIINWSEDCWVHGVRVWKCPLCAHWTEQGYSYIRYYDLDRFR
jgi:hypothetical protein